MPGSVAIALWVFYLVLLVEDTNINCYKLNREDTQQ